MTTNQPATEVHRTRRWVLPAVLAVACLAAATIGYLVVPGARPPAPADADQAGTATGDPVEVTAHYRPHGPIGQAWWQTLPASVPARDLPAGSDCPSLRDWLRARGGIDRGWSEVAVTIRAKQPAEVEIRSIRSRLESAAAPPAVHTVLCVPDEEPHMARADQLRHDMGFLVDRDGYASNLLSSDPQYNRISLGFGEIQELYLNAHAQSCDCTWTIEVDLLVDGQPRQWRVTEADTGRPFRTIAPPRSPGDSSANVVWCAPDGKGRLTAPDRRDCPVPTVYETPLY